MKDPCRMSKRDRHGNDQYYMASSQRPAHTAECRILLGLVCSSTRLHGVTDLRSGPRPKQGVVCEVPSGRTTTGGGFGLASRRSPKDSNQSVFLMIRPHPGASYSDLGYQTSGARLAGLGEVPGPAINSLRAKYPPPPILYPSYTLTSPFNTQRVINTVKTKTT